MPYRIPSPPRAAPRRRRVPLLIVGVLLTLAGLVAALRARPRRPSCFERCRSEHGRCVMEAGRNPQAAQRALRSFACDELARLCVDGCRWE